MAHEYQSLLWPDAAPIVPGKINKNPKAHRRGCEYCPRNEVHGIRKIKGTVEGKKIFVWAQSPGPDENLKGRELIGRAGQWFWNQMVKAKIYREECDIQNVMRCWPTDKKNGVMKMRDPSKEELHCCSLYTDQAIQKSRAKVHIVLGKIAAKQLFGAKHPGICQVFWSDKMNGKVVILDHPAFFVRGYGSEVRERAFRVGLQVARRIADGKSGKFGYLKEMDYVAVTTKAAADNAATEIRAEAKKGIRIIVDMESGKTHPNGPTRALCYGFSSARGKAWVFLLWHETGVAVKRSVRRYIQRVAESLLSDPEIKKACHHGSFDVTETKEVMGCELKGYDFDTNYSEFFAYPGRRSYALAEIAKVRFPDFADYKEVIMPEAAPEGMTYKQAYRQGKLDFAKVPWEKLFLYNAADCDLSKRIEESTSKVCLPLLHIYMDAAFTLGRMEKNGPYFDYKQGKALGQIYPKRLERQRQELQVLAGDPSFNPNAPAEVAKVIYDKFDIEPLEKFGRSTNKEALEILAPQNPFIRKQIDYRKDMKLDSTYRIGFENCANAHNGRLFTKWWLTGTRTGRISSGGSRDGEEFITVNLQNIHGDEQVKNMLVSDPNWRDIYQTWKDDGEANPVWYKEFLERMIYLILDYSQNELRFLAQSADDPELIAAFNSGKDIHCVVGHELTGWSIDEIANNDKKRRLVKNFHFGMVYGLSVDGMVSYLKVNGVKNVKRNEVKEMMDRYFNKYRKVKKFIKAMQDMVERLGYVENILGFRVPIQATTGVGASAHWANQAVNTPIQGGAHQLLLVALAILKRKPKTYSLIKVPNMEIHDAVVNSVKLKDVFEAIASATELLEKAVLQVVEEDFGIKWKIPLKADCKVGFRFGVAVKIKKDMTTDQLMNTWCKENKKSVIALQKEMAKVSD